MKALVNMGIMYVIYMNNDLSEWMDESYISACVKPVRDNVHPVSRGSAVDGSALLMP